MTALLIARRDLAAYLTSYFGYFIIAALLLMNGLLFYLWGLGTSPRYSTEVLEYFFEYGGGCTVAAAWLLSMRAVAEERDNRTELVLQTSPLRDWEIIAGKYLAVMGMVTLYIVLTLHIPMLILVNGKVSLAHIAVGYLGMWMLGSAVSAIGLFASALARVHWGAQVLAAVLSGFLIVLAIVFWIAGQFADPPMDVITEHMAIWNKHFVPFQEGQLNTTHLIYYVSVTWLFLLLATRIIERRRWK